MLSVLLLSVALAKPDLPVFSEATFDEAAAKFWPASSMVLVVAGEQWTQEDWERSAWADPELAEFFRSKRIPVVYADLRENAAACWLLDIDRTPAVIVFTGGQERGRRYGGSKDDDLVAWYKQITSGSSPVAELRKRIAAEPDNVRLRGELIRELGRAGDELGSRTETAWFLMNPDRIDGMSDEPSSEADTRRGLLWFVGGLREPLRLWGVGPLPARARERSGSSPRTWEDVERLAGMPDAEKESLRYTQHIARLAVEARDMLQSRVDAGTASERDRFVLEALTASEDGFTAMLEEVTDRQKATKATP